ncbi:hypothetical protein H6F86_14740 [Phormidium sp. FACHB-592]|uniref:Uncharacterized protein n=1 Tax=Stenomitos frigidus AS-A4 TaxID=2933935 RepID=A0ABV0KLR7_9CYAN|nr:hypothetical protein [Phormidium sp. FACHB-592]MBD2075128.1 hypothetical protein [Phormidium sp. FACHB-592]
MHWLQGLLNKNRSEPPQVTNIPEEQSSTTVQQVIVEETVMAVAQWLITLLNRSMKSKPTSDSKSEESPPTDRIAPIEDLLSKFGNLIEQLHKRDQETIALQNRLAAIEASLQQKSNLEQIKELNQLVAGLDSRLTRIESFVESININAIEALLSKDTSLEQQAKETSQLIANLDSRLVQTETLIAPVNFLVEKKEQDNRTLITLKERIIQLEGFIARFRAVPRIVEGNYRAIASLQNYLGTSKAHENGNYKTPHL